MTAAVVPRWARRALDRLLLWRFYARRRRHLRYYRAVERIARRRAAQARSALDVGPYDVDLLERLDWIPRRTAIDLKRKPRLPSATNIQGDFLTYAPEAVFDLVLCLQVLEHLTAPGPFAAKLLATGRTVILSVPYRWPAGTCANHVQDPVDEDKLLSWTGRPWEEMEIVSEKDGSRRLIAVFAGTTV